jgi:glycine/D-amino acid oxidase-like deaminating enzyme/nitrite reductase/ring-hydroxylating ferredoxin subunit
LSTAQRKDGEETAFSARDPIPENLQEIVMHKPAGSSSMWMDSAPMRAWPPLSGNLDVDICVIGAGIAGLTTAMLLQREGRRVALLEAKEVGAGETGRTTAHFMPPDEHYYEIESHFGKKASALVAQSYAAATSRVENLMRELRIDCQWERLPGYLFAPTAKDWSGIDREYRAARRAGVHVQLLEHVPGLPFDTGPALQFFDQAQFHPLRYLDGLAQAFAKGGGSLHCQTWATAVRREGNARLVQCESGQVRCHSVVVATNTPFHDLVTMHTKQEAWRTYVLGLRMPKGSMPHVLLWDTGDPYYYVRIEPGVDPLDDILVVGGLDHKVGKDAHAQHRYTEIEAWTRSRFPACKDVAWRWSGEVMEPADGLPFLGRDPTDEQVYMITGDSGNGMTHCTAGAMLVTDLIQGRANAWAALYDPARKMQRGIGSFVKGQVDAMAQMAERLRGGDVDSSAEIVPGEGAIVRENGERLAVYRDDEGHLHVLSAACTHLGCSVAWNSAENSWDCPCHGSRFDVDGEVLHGPAKTALPKRELEYRHVPPPDGAKLPSTFRP